MVLFRTALLAEGGFIFYKMSHLLKQCKIKVLIDLLNQKEHKDRRFDPELRY